MIKRIAIAIKLNHWRIFGRRTAKKTVMQDNCKICKKATRKYGAKQVAQRKIRYEKHKGELLLKSKIYFAKHKDEINARRRKHHAKHGIKPHRKDNRLNCHYLRKYGITLKQYETMFVAQNGGCAICGQPETVKNKSGKVRLLAVDHDHSTNRVRKLLCSRCNKVLGSLDDNPTLLRAAADYIDRFRPGA